MAKFASSCLELMATTTATLELSLGPGTADLALRVGMHSGPTIAGVLRGEKARFQLFGDTVNTASRMESSSQPNKIQVSQKTAELIVETNRGHWLTARKDLVNAKGKGLLQTYWLNPRKARTGSVVSSVEDLASSNGDMEEQDTETMPFSSAAEFSNDKLLRLINWNVELFEEMLKPIVQRRMESLGGSLSNIMPVEEQILANGASPRDKIVPSVRMPGFKVDTVNQVDLGPEVTSQLRNYITSIANLYNSANAFHNFEHASHVIMSTLKLLQRASTNMKLDPLTKFAICFSALIHDLDHSGVSNGQLVKEEVREPLI
jgi:Adenylate and Guanylate cyclase catalytic domain/3'5'-cyclic nucleotide phosphodiesterase